MRIDVYDFDGTIYDGDSTVDFTRFCLRRHPAVLAGLPRFIGTSVLLALGRRNLTQFKSVLFGEMAKRFSLEKESSHLKPEGTNHMIPVQTVSRLGLEADLILEMDTA